MLRLVTALFLLWVSDAQAYSQWLLYTVPDHGQACTMTLGQEGDSVLVCDCETPGPRIYSIFRSYLWGQRITGGGFALIDSHSVVADEGKPDSFPVPWPGNFYIQTRNLVGLSCASNVATVLPDVTTGVELEPRPPRVIVEKWFDVHGRRIATAFIGKNGMPRRSGIYYVRWTVRDRFIGQKKVVMLRGRPISPFKRPEP